VTELQELAKESKSRAIFEWWQSDPVTNSRQAKIDWEAEAKSGRCFFYGYNSENNARYGPFLLGKYRGDLEFPFRDFSGTVMYRFAKIATIQGVWRSWQGGICQVENTAMVSIICANGHIAKGRANEFCWLHFADWHENSGKNIVAFCWLPEELQ